MCEHYQAVSAPCVEKHINAGSQRTSAHAEEAKMQCPGTVFVDWKQVWRPQNPGHVTHFGEYVVPQ